MSTNKIDDDITQRFTPREPDPERLAKLVALRTAAIEFTATIRKLCPGNDRRVRAEEHIEIGVMLAGRPRAAW